MALSTGSGAALSPSQSAQLSGAITTGIDRAWGWREKVIGWDVVMTVKLCRSVRPVPCGACKKEALESPILQGFVRLPVHTRPLSSFSIHDTFVDSVVDRGIGMAKTVGKLTALKTGRALPPGMYADGAGLYLQVTEPERSRGFFVFPCAVKREKWAWARSKRWASPTHAPAERCRGLCQRGIDPIGARMVERAQAALEDAKATTFKEAAERYIAAHRAGWKAAKHAGLWENTLATYAYPVIGKISVQAIDTDLVLKVLEPIWTKKPETASRVRGRMEVILDWAKSRGLRQGENPARWRGHLQFQLPARFKVRRVKHHAALPHAELPEFVAELRKQVGIGALALEFTILTAARTGEIIGATRDETNLSERVWTVPAARIKGGKEHRVPLSSRALAILKTVTAPENGEHAFVFPGGKSGRPLSNVAMAAVLKRMGRADVTVHGFRSTFRDWAAERTNYPSEVVEMALAHAVGNKVEAAYRRGDLFEKRRRLMADWCTFCNTPASVTRGAVYRCVGSNSRQFTSYYARGQGRS